MIITLKHYYKYDKFQCPPLKITINDYRFHMSCFQYFQKLGPSPYNVQFHVSARQCTLKIHKYSRTFNKMPQSFRIRAFWVATNSHGHILSSMAYYMFRLHTTIDFSSIFFMTFSYVAHTRNIRWTLPPF